VGFVAAPPARYLSQYEEERHGEHGDRPFAAGGRAGYVLGFGLGCDGLAKSAALD
jgi:hypothetical protein